MARLPKDQYIDEDHQGANMVDVCKASSNLCLLSLQPLLLNFLMIFIMTKQKLTLE